MAKVFRMKLQQVHQYMASGIQVYNAPVYHSHPKKSKGNASGGVRKRYQKKKEKRRCFRCRKSGHIVRDCPDPPTPQKPNNKTTTNTQKDVTIDDVTEQISMVTVNSVNTQEETEESNANHE
eukprot:XP_016657135.1 PREDICTED: uncharacterized protein LOC107882768 [Acyrthosiphon pisum]